MHRSSVLVWASLMAAAGTIARADDPKGNSTDSGNGMTGYAARFNELMGQGQLKEALTEAERIVAEHPNDALSHRCRGLALYGFSEDDKAIAAFDEAIRLDPRQAVLYASRGMAWQAKGECDKAIADFDEAIRLDPNGPHVYINRARAWQSKGQYDKAIADLNQALALDSSIAVAFVMRGTTWMFRHDYDKAIVDLNEAIRLSPNSSNYINRAGALMQAECYSEALKDCDTAIQLDPHSTYAYYAKGNIFLYMREYGKAVAIFDEALRQGLAITNTYSGRGMAHVQLGNYPQAAADFKQALRFDPSNAAIFFQYAYARQICREHGLAIADAGNKNPNTAPAAADDEAPPWNPQQQAVAGTQPGLDEVLTPHPQSSLEEILHAPTTNPELVGDWGRIERITIEGAKTFSAEEIVDDLRHTGAFIAARQVSAPLAVYIQTIMNRIHAGYQYAGFPETGVWVDLDRDASRIEVTINEGPRCTCGDVEVLGALEVDVPRLKQWLATKYPTDDVWVDGFDTVDGRLAPRWVGKYGGPARFQDIAWDPGKPAHFDEGSDAARRKAIVRGLGDQGFRLAKFEASVVDNTDDCTATLRINILDEGVLSQIGRIEVKGLERDTPADVLKYLELKEGDLYTEVAYLQWMYKLWMSARYRRTRIDLEANFDTAKFPKQDESEEQIRAALESAIDRKRPAALTITLEEYKPASPLREPLAIAEQAALNLRAWLLKTIASGDDLVAEWSTQHGNLTAIYADRDGLLLHYVPSSAQPVDESANAPEVIHSSFGIGLPVEIVAVARPKEIVLLHAPWHKQLCVPFLFESELAGQVQMHLHRSEQQSLLMLGCGLVNRKADDNSTRLKACLVPVAMLAQTHNEGVECKVEDGIALFSRTDLNGRMRVEIETGRLIECSFTDGEEHACTLNLSVKPGAFAARWRDIESKLPQPLAELPNDYDAKRPMSSLVESLLGSPLLNVAISECEMDDAMVLLMERIRTIAAKMLRAGALVPIDELVSQLKSHATDSEEEFYVPLRSGDRSHRTISVFRSLAMWCDEVFGDKLFSYGTWPSRLWNDYILQYFDDAMSAHRDYVDLNSSPTFGPFGRLVAAKMDQRWAASMTANGLFQIDSTVFFVECKPFLDRNTYAGAQFCKIAEILRDTDDGDVALLAGLLPDNSRKLLLNASRLLHEHRHEKIEDALPEVLDTLWADGLRDIVRQQLDATFLANSESSDMSQKIDSVKTTNSRVRTNSAARGAQRGRPAVVRERRPRGRLAWRPR